MPIKQAIQCCLAEGRRQNLHLYAITCAYKYLCLFKISSVELFLSEIGTQKLKVPIKMG